MCDVGTQCGCYVARVPAGPDVLEALERRFDQSVEEFARELSIAYPAGRPDALLRMARHSTRRRDDGRYELKMDPALRGAMGAAESEQDAYAREEEMVKQLWDSLADIACPTLVVRGAASDILAPEIADRMVDEVLPNGKLAVVPQAGHSVMTDNPEGFRDAVAGFVLSD